MGKNLVGAFFLLVGLAVLIFPSAFSFFDGFGLESEFFGYILLAIGVFIIGFLPSKPKTPRY